MTGRRQMAQEALLYDSNLARHAPDNWVRAIDRFVNFTAYPPPRSRTTMVTD